MIINMVKVSKKKTNNSVAVYFKKDHKKKYDDLRKKATFQEYVRNAYYEKIEEEKWE